MTPVKFALEALLHRKATNGVRVVAVAMMVAGPKDFGSRQACCINERSIQMTDDNITAGNRVGAITMLQKPWNELSEEEQRAEIATNTPRELEANMEDRSGHPGEAHVWSPTGNGPEYLKGVAIPADVFAAISPHVSGDRSVADYVIMVAWHETGHAIPWVLNGGRLKRTTIIPKAYDGGILWGECRYEIEDVERLSMIDRHRLALAAMGSSALCKLAGNFDYETMHDFEGAIDDLQPLYPRKMDLYEQLVRSYVKVFELFGTPRVWRTADAFARLLVAHGTIEGFPPECISTDNSPIAGLAEALAKSLSSPCDWLLDYLKYK